MSNRLFYLLAVTPVAGPSPLWLVLRHVISRSRAETETATASQCQHWAGWPGNIRISHFNSQQLNSPLIGGKGQYFLTGANSLRISCSVLCEACDVTLILISITRDGLSPQYFYHIAFVYTRDSFISQPASSHIIRIWAVPITWYLHVDPRDACHTVSHRVASSHINVIFTDSFDYLSPHFIIFSKNYYVDFGIDSFRLY